MATSYDKESDLLKMYEPSIIRTLKDLNKNGATVLNEIDATNLNGDLIDPENK